jgi:hypothetical protein
MQVEKDVICTLLAAGSSVSRISTPASGYVAPWIETILATIVPSPDND